MSTQNKPTMNETLAELAKNPITKILGIIICLVVLVTLSRCGVASNSSVKTLQKQVETIQNQPVPTQSAVKDWTTEINSLRTQDGVLGQDIAKANSLITNLNKLATDASADAKAAKAAAIETSNQAKITQLALDSMKGTFDQLVAANQANLTTIGTKPVNVNGISVTFITNNPVIASPSTTIPTTAQMALKVTNTSGKIITNVDITGTITATPYLANMPAGYPSLVDGATAFLYNYYFNGSNAINFEVYNNVAKQTITLNPGDSITLRPRVSILSSATQVQPASTLTLSLSNISYDTK